ncbi:MAG: KH domain-containing protein [Chloroflexi bacterium]|nr:KH domain-containing protein [Chloroflexota bacterium]
MKELITYIAQSIVDDPEAVAVTEVVMGDRRIYRLSVAPGDMGKVIGKQGRIAWAIRTLLRVAAIKEDAHAVLEIV